MAAAHDLHPNRPGILDSVCGRSRPPSVLTIQRANPIECAASLKSFFAANEFPALVALVDTAYPEVARSGGANWIGVDDAGDVQLNVTLFRHDFEFRGRKVQAGMLANMVASKEYRWFFPSVSLVSRVVQDVVQESELDFLYSDPQPGAAVVSKAAGLKELGALDRFVIPVSDSRRSYALAARAYAAAVRLRIGFAAATCTTVDSTAFDGNRFAIPIGMSSRLRPHHSASMYRRRLLGYPGPDYVWYEFRLPGHRRAKEPDAAVLLYGPDERRVAHVRALRRAPSVALSALIPGLLRGARGRGAHRLEIETIRESNLARELLRFGFRKRGDFVPVFGKGITAAGDEVVNAIHEWEITTFDMER